VPTSGPAERVDVARARDVSNLQLDIAANGSDTLKVGNSTVYKIDYTFRGRGPADTEWTHRASLLLPTEINSAITKPGAFALLPGSTRNPTKVSQPKAFRKNYGAEITAQLGIPTVLVSGIPGSVNLRKGPSAWSGQAERRCYTSNLPEARYASCLLQILRKTDDLEADPFRYLADSWIRAVTAASEVGARADRIDWGGNPPPAVQMDRAVVMAEGASAVGARMAAAIDVRIDGVFGHGSFARFGELMNGLSERWSSDFGWFDDPGAFRDWLQTEPGRAWRAAVDPAEWSDMLEGKAFVLASATNDGRVPLGATDNIVDVFPSETRRLIAGGKEGRYAEGIGSPTHLAGWRGFIAHVYFGAPWNSVRISTERQRGNVAVEADVRGEAETKSARVAWVKRASADDRDFRDTSWSESKLEPEKGVEGIWSGQFAPIVTNYASYAQVYQTVTVPSILESKSEVSITSAWASSVDFAK
jgi:hypothetical protein